MNLLLKVLHFLKESLSKPAPVPFAQNAQYKKNIAAHDEENGDEGEDEKPAQATTQRKQTKRKKKKTTKKGPARLCDAKAAKQPVAEPLETEECSPHRYTLLRKDFIDKLRNDGASYKSAIEDWNNSKLKRQLLCNVPLNELKRRRFVPKECEKNPWTDA